MSDTSIIKWVPVTGQGTNYDFVCPVHGSTPFKIEFPATLTSTTFSIHSLNGDGSGYELNYDLETNVALFSALALTAGRMYVFDAQDGVKVGNPFRIVMGASEGSDRTIRVGFRKFV